MRKVLYAVLLFVIPFSDNLSQMMITEFAPNALRMRLRSNGLMEPSPSAGAITLAGISQPGMVYSGGLWLSASNSIDDLRVATHKYGQQGHDFFSGPLTNDGSASISAEVSAGFDRIWTVTAGQIAQHRSYFECLSDPGCDLESEFPNGYEIPNVFLDWPAHGNVGFAQDLYIAPFQDHDGDGFYDPQSGDHPCVPGDQAVFMVFNDVLQSHAESGGDPLGVEVHKMPFGYYATSGIDLHYTLFVSYKIINRTNQPIQNFRISEFADFDLGCGNDDNIGTDVGRNMVYVYNGDDSDEPCFSLPAFGEQPPAFGLMVLKGPLLEPNGEDDPALVTLPSINGSGFGDGIVDNERHGLSRSMHFRREGNAAQTEPENAEDHLDFQRSVWKNGVPLTYGGNGYSENGSAINSRFAFPGDSDPNGAGTSGNSQPPWYDYYSPSLQDPKALATMGPITLDPGEIQEILIAYIYARADEGGALASVTALQQRADNVRAFAQNIPGLMAAGSLCDEMPVGIATIRRPRALAIHPNPAHDLATVVLDEKITNGSLEVFDLAGRKIMELPVSGSVIMIPIEDLTPGSYHLRLVESGTIRSGRFIKE